MEVAPDPKSGLTFIYHFLVDQYIGMACFMLAFFEWTITLDLEVALIWNSRWGLAKIAFLVNRYLPVVNFVLTYIRDYGFLPIGACKPLNEGVGFIYLVTLYVSDYVFVLRTCAVWGMKKKMVIALAVFYLGSFVFIAHNYFSSVAPLHYFSVHPLITCIAFQGNVPRFYVSCILLVVYDAVMLALMIYPTVKEHRGKDGTTTSSEFMKTIYTEGTLFYAYLLILSCTALITELQVPDNMYLFTSVNPMVRSVLACRVILNIRKLSTKRQIGSFSAGGHLSGVSEMRFA